MLPSSAASWAAQAAREAISRRFCSSGGAARSSSLLFMALIISISDLTSTPTLPTLRLTAETPAATPSTAAPIFRMDAFSSLICLATSFISASSSS